MRNKIAKQLRREIYGDLAHRDKRYGLIRHIKKFFSKKEGKHIDVVRGQIRCTGPRAEYLKAKKAYKKGAGLKCAAR